MAFLPILSAISASVRNRKIFAGRNNRSAMRGD
jgi:hypothetical protein